MALVLCTGVDAVLMKTRQLILQNAGHRVLTATDEPGVIAACQQNKFEVVVIGHATSVAVQKQIMLLIRKYCPSAKVLELHRFATGRRLDDADSWLEVPVEAEELAERVAVLAVGA